MSKAKLGTKTDKIEQYMINCPGCGHAHVLPVKGPNPRWDFNGDLESPTFKPSLLIYYIDPDTKARVSICHSFITDGKIRFLNDCQHKLKGQTVDLPDFD